MLQGHYLVKAEPAATNFVKASVLLMIVGRRIYREGGCVIRICDKKGMQVWVGMAWVCLCIPLNVPMRL